MKKRLFIFCMFFAGMGFKADKPAYQLFDINNKKIEFSLMVKQAQDADIVLFGELHNNPISHWLQLELITDLHHTKGTDLILAAEMFESDNQVILDEYIKGFISQSRFEDEARLWPNYKTDYKPLVEFARENRLAFVASNIPRRYAAIVNSKGFEGLEELSDEAKKFLPPLPVIYNPELNAYKNMLKMDGTEHHANENFPKAQAVKDATMAHFIMKNWKEGKLLVHFNGAYHSDNFESIYWYLKQNNPDLNIITITTVSQKNILELDEEHKGKAHFIINVNEKMTNTY
jgi:uncharacterized iron-regulated protein